MVCGNSHRKCYCIVLFYCNLGIFVGLTTAFMRPFMSTQWVNGSLVTIQEISGGILKRGHVDVVIEANGEQKELFSVNMTFFTIII